MGRHFRAAALHVAGRPFGNESFVSEMSQRFGRYWERGRPKKENRN